MRIGRLQRDARPRPAAAFTVSVANLRQIDRCAGMEVHHGTIDARCSRRRRRRAADSPAPETDAACRTKNGSGCWLCRRVARPARSVAAEFAWPGCHQPLLPARCWKRLAQDGSGRVPRTRVGVDIALALARKVPNRHAVKPPFVADSWRRLSIAPAQVAGDCFRLAAAVRIRRVNVCGCGDWSTSVFASAVRSTSKLDVRPPSSA